MRLVNISTCLIYTFIYSAVLIESYKYLGVLHTGSYSHFIVGSTLMKALAQKGHEVYVISPYPQTQPIKNYYDIPLENMVKLINDRTKDLFGRTEKNIFQNMIGYYNMGLNLSETFWSEPNVQQLLGSNHTFDAVICEVFFSESLFGLSEYFQAPLIGLGTFGAISWNTDMVGSPSPPSYVPHAMLKFTDHMSFSERVGNLAFNTFDKLLMEYYYLPRQAVLYEKHFRHLKRGMYEVRKSAAAVLLNSHVSLGYPRPYVPNQIEVGGMHINRQLKPLPEDIEKFIKESKHGVVYFSMGSVLKSKYLTATKRQEFLAAFKNLKQRVLWKFEGPLGEDKPGNVFISDWLPQSDILAHENVKVFITHGGLLSTTESIYHGKPVIGIPIYGDQFLNMAKAENSGFGITLDFQTLTAHDLTAAIQRVINDKRYSQSAKEISARYRDQPMLPLDLAVYWAEHIVRQKGARYLHCAGLDLGFIAYHNIDAMLVLYGGIIYVLFAFFYILKVVIRAAWRKLRTKKPAKQNKKKNN